jgi:ribonucleoside-diphosphate reductase alpha chain
LILAQEIMVDNAGYPTPAFERNRFDFRPLGLGYANLGALLMACGVPYDSEAGRAYAAAVTALMTGQAYLTSSKIAKIQGPFAAYAVNRDPMLRVIRKHRSSLQEVEQRLVPNDLMQAATDAWDDALALGMQYGYRNSQVTVLAPTGTISFMMDCDTTGVEPDIALIKYKKLSGGGMIKMVNATVPLALRRLGYATSQIKEIIQYIDAHGTIEGAPFLQEAHLPVFDCAFRPAGGTRSIHYMGHIRMMAGVQPFLSGAISKTVNMPKEATIEEIEQAYIGGWKLGVKALAIYRDGCKRTQPLNTTANAERTSQQPLKPIRRRLPDDRPAITHKFSIAGHEGYITVGMFDDGTPGEIFLVVAKEGSTISGLMDAFATSISLALQYGVPLKALIDKFSHMRFEPSGYTKNREIPFAKSIMDYIFRWLASKFLAPEDRAQVGIIEQPDGDTAAKPILPRLPMNGVEKMAGATQAAPGGDFIFHLQEDAPPCAECGALMIRNGACYKCLNCGATSGCS